MHIFTPSIVRSAVNIYVKQIANNNNNNKLYSTPKFTASARGMHWLAALLMGTVLERGEGGELDAKCGGSVEQITWERGGWGSVEQRA